jgi:hypothetical protein
MKLSTDQIKLGILHPEPIVRQACIGFFSESYSHDASLLPLVVRAIEQYGWEATLGFPHSLGELPLADETLLWAVEQLQRLARREPPERAFDWLLSRALSVLIQSADAELLARHESLVLDAPLAEVSVDDLQFKLGLRSLDGEECWNRLDELLDEQCVYSAADLNAPCAVSLLQRLAADGDRFDERIVAELRAYDESDWLEDEADELRMGFMAELAGRRRLDAAVAPLLELVQFDDVMVCDSCERALIEIGTLRVLDELRGAVAVASGWSARTFLFNVLAHLRVEGVVAVCRELLESDELTSGDTESDDELDDDLAGALDDERLSLRSQLVLAMARQFDSDGLQAAIEWYRNDGAAQASVDLDDIRNFIVCGHLLMGLSCDGLDELRTVAETQLDAQATALQQDAETSPLCREWDDDEDYYEDYADEYDDEPTAEGTRYEASLMQPSMADFITGRASRHVPIADEEMEDERLAPIVREMPKVGRNDPCPCGSGKKFKKCCMKSQSHSQD